MSSYSAAFVFERLVPVKLKDVFKELGMALIIAGAIGLLYELRMRKAFISEIEETFKRINDRRDELNSAGIRRTYRSFAEFDVRDKFVSAKSIRILQVVFGDYYVQVRAALHAAVESGCRDIRILLVQPDSKHAEYRKLEVGATPRDIAEAVKYEVEGLKDLYKAKEHLFNGKGRFEISLYRATPIIPIYGYDDVNIVGIFWHGQNSQSGPHIEVGMVSKQKPYFAEAISNHFEEIWKQSEIPPEAWDPEELGSSHERAEVSPTKEP